MIKVIECREKSVRVVKVEGCKGGAAYELQIVIKGVEPQMDKFI